MIGGRKFFGLTMPRFAEPYEVECIYVQVDGRLVPVSSEEIAQKDVAYYQKEGKSAEIVKRMETRRDEILP